MSLGSYIREHWGKVVLASVSVVLLGLISSGLAISMGPALKFLLDSTTQIPLVELLGPSFSNAFLLLGAPEKISGADVFSFLPLLLIVLAFFRLSMSFLVFNLWEQISESIGYQLRQRVFDGFVHLSPEVHFEDWSKDIGAEITAGISNDIRQVKQYIVRFYGSIPRELCQILTILPVLIVLSPWLTAMFFFAGVPAAIFLAKLAKKLGKRSRSALDTFSELAEWIQQRLMGFETIKQYRTEDFETKKMNHFAKGLFERYLRVARVKARSAPMTETIAMVALSGIILLGFYFVESGVTSASIQVSFLASLAILAQSGNKLGRYFNARVEGEIAWDRLSSLISRLEAGKGSVERRYGKQGVGDDTVLKCKDISISFPNASSPVINNFSCEFRKKKVYCLQGESGAGKSTLAMGIMGLLPLSSGEITFFSEVEGERLPITYMPQMQRPIPGDLGTNVCYPGIFDPKDNVQRAKVTQALNEAGLKTKGRVGLQLDLKIGSEGQELSGGQLQRLALARVFYHKSPIVIADESTSALDNETETEVISGLKRLADQGSCVILIAHKATVLKYADQLLTLDKGRLHNSKV